MWVAALLTASCTPALKVEVANTTPTERDDETVEIAWSGVTPLSCLLYTSPSPRDTR